MPADRLQSLTFSHHDPRPRDARRRVALIGAWISGLALVVTPAARPVDYCKANNKANPDQCLVTGEVFVDRPIPHRLEVPLAKIEVDFGGTPLWTDQEGWLEATCEDINCVAQLASSQLSVADQCGVSGPSAMTQTSAFSLSGDVPIYDCDTDCAVPQNLDEQGVTWAARTAFHWADQAIRKAKIYVAGQNIPTVRIETNHSDTSHSSGSHMLCAGYWNSATQTIDLFQSGGGCGNTGENPSIVVHEWGHALFEKLYSPTGPLPIDATTNEAQADVQAALVTGDTCIGRGVRPAERCHGCGKSCNGLRDLKAFSLFGSNPAMPQRVFASDGLDCSQGDGLLGAAPHCESLIASTAFMDLVELLRINLGDDELATEIAEQLFYGSLPGLTQVFQEDNGVTDGCNPGSWYRALLAADDALVIDDIQLGDNNPNNGTPHGCLIFQAFDAHGIACSTPLTCPPWLSAGPDVETCVGTSVTIGQPQPSSRTISWSTATPGGVIPGPQSPVLSVTPDAIGTTTYTMTATHPGFGASSDTVNVRAYGCYSSLVEDFEASDLSTTWEATGLWHRIDDHEICPKPSSGMMYFGLDTCHYETCRGAHGDLISDVISVPATPTEDYQPALTFDSLRGVETYVHPIATDRTEVWIEEWPVTPTSRSDLRWARSSASALPSCDPMLGDCPYPDTVLPISLAPYAGRNIRVRFHFDSLDAAHNRYTGWLIDNVLIQEVDEDLVKGEVLPTLMLQSPAEGEALACCACTDFVIEALDSFGTDISDQVVWSSEATGRLGSGRGIQMVLPPTRPPGPVDPRVEALPLEHTITATVVDRFGQTNSIQFTVEVPDDGQACGLLSLTPAELRRNCAAEDDR